MGRTGLTSPCDVEKRLSNTFKYMQTRFVCFVFGMTLIMNRKLPIHGPNIINRENPGSNHLVVISKQAISFTPRCRGSFSGIREYMVTDSGGNM